MLTLNVTLLTAALQLYILQQYYPLSLYYLVGFVLVAAYLKLPIESVVVFVVTGAFSAVLGVVLGVDDKGGVDSPLPPGPLFKPSDSIRPKTKLMIWVRVVFAVDWLRAFLDMASILKAAHIIRIWHIGCQLPFYQPCNFNQWIYHAKS